MHNHVIEIDGETLTVEDVVSVARQNVKVALSESTKRKVTESRKALQKMIAEGKVIYGVNTGFGALANTKISPEEIRQLQVNLIRSHSTGVGKAFHKEVVRAAMLLRANTLAKGYSGVRLKVLETLVKMLNEHVHPVIPEKGSVGASGDLAPLSHLTLVLMGEGEAEYQGRVLTGKQAMEQAGIQPLTLEEKEGLALNNGTQVMTALAALAVHDAEKLVQTAEVAAALTLEAMLGVYDAFDERIHEVRPHPGQMATARNIRSLIHGSKLIRLGKEALETLGYPQDPYSLRCIPQVLGAARDAVAYTRKVVEIEINSATDNPLVFASNPACFSGGNFHGQPIAIAMDMLGIAITMVGNFSERRTARLIDEKLNRGLPAFLVSSQATKGLNSGFMTLQYTAAALASENKILAHPACVDSIPTSANFEDFVSMGTTAARKAKEIIRNTQNIIGIELICAAQAIEFRGWENLGKGTKQAYKAIRDKVPRLEEDRQLSIDIETVVRELVQNGKLVEVIRDVVALV
jgi:histidine ammonia-lyase